MQATAPIKVTIYPPAVAKGADVNKLTRKAIAAKRALWRKENAKPKA